MNTLVYIEGRDGRPTRDSLALVSRAAALGGDVCAVASGVWADDEIAGVGAYGASRVIVCDGGAADRLSAPFEIRAFATLVGDGGFDTIFFGTSVLTADVAGGLAARLEAGVNWDLMDVELRDGELVGTRLLFGDSVLVDVGWVGVPRIALFRNGAQEPVAGGEPAVVERVTIADDANAPLVVERLHSDGASASIEEAEIIVAGGRGLGDRSGFQLLEGLAEELGAAVAASMPVVDLGWYPYSNQVGQTGKTVRPRLYLACGISGAIQHKIGMDQSELIVAINRDRSAPIFRFCDIGVVGDLHEIVPKLRDSVRSHKLAAPASAKENTS